MSGTYLEGAIQYPRRVAEEYRRRGFWTSETYIDLWERAARRDPEWEALAHAHRYFTWGELEELVGLLAAGFRQLGVARYDRVLFQLPNRAEYVLAFHPAHCMEGRGRVQPPAK